MNEKNKEKEYKIGEVALVATMICSGLTPLRIDKSYRDQQGNSKTRVIFVFDRTEAEAVELKYLSGECMVEVRSFVNTIDDVRNIIRNSVDNQRG